MNILDIITKKKNKEELTYDELEFAFMGYLNKQIPDYQMSSLLMAIVINGMTIDETIDLTDIFIKSGDTYDFSDIDFVVDKHSTGGVGDSTTLVIGPMCAALGLHMAKMSGRGLGLTGGTIDKLESIPGFKVNLSEFEFKQQVKEVGFAVSSQTKNLVPLDKVIYALRDVTGTTESIPLIASSIMSKKIAAGAENILVDVKYGSGALVKTRDEAAKLSKWLITIGQHYGRNVRTVLGNMNTPLSYAVGNAIEVIEAMNVLNGKRCPLYDSCVEIVANLLSMAKGLSIQEAEIRAKSVIEDGSATKKFYEFVHAQGGKLSKMDVSPTRVKVKAQKGGVVRNIDALGAAKLAAKLGASKETLEDTIDYTVGILLKVKIGDEVEYGDVLMTLFLKDKEVQLTKEDFDFIDIEN